MSLWGLYLFQPPHTPNLLFGHGVVFCSSNRNPQTLASPPVCASSYLACTPPLASTPQCVCSVCSVLSKNLCCGWKQMSKPSAAPLNTFLLVFPSLHTVCHRAVLSSLARRWKGQGALSISSQTVVQDGVFCQSMCGFVCGAGRGRG